MSARERPQGILATPPLRKEVLQLRLSLSQEDQDHADALLLKLGRLESDQIVVSTDAGALEQGFQAVAQVA